MFYIHRPKAEQNVVTCDKWREILNSTGKNPISSPTSVTDRSLKVTPCLIKLHIICYVLSQTSVCVSTDYQHAEDPEGG